MKSSFEATRELRIQTVKKLRCLKWVIPSQRLDYTQSNQPKCAQMATNVAEKYKNFKYSYPCCLVVFIPCRTYSKFDLVICSSVLLGGCAQCPNVMCKLNPKVHVQICGQLYSALDNALKGSVLWANASSRGIKQRGEIT